jgi:potassium channel subfamily K member 9
MNNNHCCRCCCCCFLFSCFSTIFSFDLLIYEHRKQRLERKFLQFKLDHNMTNETFRQLSDLIINKTHVSQQWKYYDSFYFSTVVLALIGYGHRILITTRAKIFCVLYAMLGIPMWLITFQSAGERLNSLLSYSLSKIKQTLQMKQTKITDGELLVMESILSMIILLLGACVFSKYEGWSFFDAFYYGFITLTTIGFGDYVVLVSKNMFVVISFIVFYLQRKRTLNVTFIDFAPYYFFCLSFIFLGLIVVASLMNLLVIRIVAFYSQERLLEKLREEEAARQAVFLKGDVICSLNNNPKQSLITSEPLNNQSMWTTHSSQTSVCSCTCLETFHEWRDTRKKRAQWRQRQRMKTKMKQSDSTLSMKFNFASRRSSI